ncbi:hypothetical protein KIPB_008970 [Kipferlia bialata]|uniref:Uncharacterized protein n=1 Tax=Kipferlia bialata TaxID=797122 RepID=A0A9K3GL59_9EUKA|nr:hypothetical protein KIPB_007434 [Kipferlia bialata]GIQ87013.1 hypothetical protein KIPB_008970 [Kipferlia bialata]|eukprot:g7434.t1
MIYLYTNTDTQVSFSYSADPALEREAGDRRMVNKEEIDMGLSEAHKTQRTLSYTHHTQTSPLVPPIFSSGALEAVRHSVLLLLCPPSPAAPVFVTPNGATMPGMARPGFNAVAYQLPLGAWCLDIGRQTLSLKTSYRRHADKLRVTLDAIACRIMPPTDVPICFRKAIPVPLSDYVHLQGSPAAASAVGMAVVLCAERVVHTSKGVMVVLVDYLAVLDMDCAVLWHVCLADVLPKQRWQGPTVKSTRDTPLSQGKSAVAITNCVGLCCQGSSVIVTLVSQAWVVCLTPIVVKGKGRAGGDIGQYKGTVRWTLGLGGTFRARVFAGLLLEDSQSHRLSREQSRQELLTETEDSDNFVTPAMSNFSGYSDCDYGAASSPHLTPKRSTSRIYTLTGTRETSQMPSERVHGVYGGPVDKSSLVHRADVFFSEPYATSTHMRKGRLEVAVLDGGVFLRKREKERQRSSHKSKGGAARSDCARLQVWVLSESRKVATLRVNVDLGRYISGGHVVSFNGAWLSVCLYGSRTEFGLTGTTELLTFDPVGNLVSLLPLGALCPNGATCMYVTDFESGTVAD